MIPKPPLYECHITIPREHAKIGEIVAKAFHWKTSKIDGDPVLGKQVFAYLTTHDTDFIRIRDRMFAVSNLLRGQGAKVVREKIEHIIYDTKTGVT